MVVDTVFQKLENRSNVFFSSFSFLISDEFNSSVKFVSNIGFNLAINCGLKIKYSSN